LNTTFLNFTNG